jgi:hypothetical protein
MIFFDWANKGESLAKEGEENHAAKISWVLGHPAETSALVEKGQEVYRRHLWQAERGRFLQLVTF